MYVSGAGAVMWCEHCRYVPWWVYVRRVDAVVHVSGLGAVVCARQPFLDEEPFAVFSGKIKKHPSIGLDCNKSYRRHGLIGMMLH